MATSTVLTRATHIGRNSRRGRSHRPLRHRLVEKFGVCDALGATQNPTDRDQASQGTAHVDAVTERVICRRRTQTGLESTLRLGCTTITLATANIVSVSSNCQPKPDLVRVIVRADRDKP